ncbi:hypothetical protein GFL57_28230 [Rhizobium leguminosarum bv. viciae]|nr:hypothetical protein [Rhizobium leguminosarum bv. viciae]
MHGVSEAPAPARLIQAGLQVGGHLAKQAPDVDSRNYGFPRLSDLVKSSGIVDIERSPENPKTILVCLKKT